MRQSCRTGVIAISFKIRGVALRCARELWTYLRPSGAVTFLACGDGVARHRNGIGGRGTTLSPGGGGN